ncbi:2-amino-4-hydroxy-6-hydroxymethyldihydropteridine diphosphokinase [Legionella maioricensis]|uniref:2-amino-4-hydroxy-6-hydroxymethyldihydropteridine pyrophosphokinase n=1 Tax=Legionella maioricensis TaxID=2896528 RepID=A0A9X2D201_9GAMM|nr:2-amino-4-hydroxy-6-hydroxymethyldihydropteridine diphosphokinase [Legionella maioricensis]MCL9685016.1 2-amino-4-hydroxy-6-hydroxymethyldihydropteridine diphosphokinase [Legionella maioricensis]MCL9688087.1 2-amino-4-hydroxy-6-hydroxymethyldihydropteridine diphosphokinase [Legionella maioricensis]
MNVCYLGLGSNQKFPERQIRQAIESISNIPSTSVIKTSSLYWNQAWGLQVQQDFCNAIVEITTLLPPLLLLKHCKKIEHKQGRIRKKRWGPRTLDIDIILYGNRRVNTKKLTIPHPYMQSRDFVLLPLLEINPNIQLL